MTGARAMLLWAVFTAGCGASSAPASSGTRISIDADQNNPSGAGIFDSTPTTLVGVALALDVVSGDPDSTQTVTIQAVDPSVATVVPSELANTFLLIGVSRGTTDLRVLIDKRPVDTITVAGSDVTTLTAAVDAQP